MEILLFLLLWDFRSNKIYMKVKLLAKVSKLNVHFHNIHVYIFTIKLISPVITVYKQTVFPISLNCPTIPYKILAATLERKSKKI